MGRIGEEESGMKIVEINNSPKNLVKEVIREDSDIVRKTSENNGACKPPITGETRSAKIVRQTRNMRMGCGRIGEEEILKESRIDRHIPKDLMNKDPTEENPIVSKSSG